MIDVVYLIWRGLRYCVIPSCYARPVTLLLFKSIKTGQTQYIIGIRYHYYKTVLLICLLTPQIHTDFWNDTFWPESTFFLMGEFVNSFIVRHASFLVISLNRSYWINGGTSFLNNGLSLTRQSSQNTPALTRRSTITCLRISPIWANVDSDVRSAQIKTHVVIITTRNKSLWLAYETTSNVMFD